MNTFLQQLVNGLTVGSFYALVALGYTMVYGVIRLINFAHGDLYMVGAFAGFTFLAALGSHVGQTNPILLIPLVFGADGRGRSHGRHHRAVGLQPAAPRAAPL